MRTKFHATITIMLGGELDLTADDIAILTDVAIGIYPNILLPPDPQLRWDLLDPEERTLILRAIQYNVIHRALAESRIAGVTTGVPEPVANVPPGSRS